MRTISSREMQKNFGSVADQVAAGEGVRITRRGRPAFLLIPDTGDSEEILRELAARKLARMLREAQPTPAAQTLTQQDINRLNGEHTRIEDVAGCLKSRRGHVVSLEEMALPVHVGQGGLANGLDGLNNQALYAVAERPRMAAEAFRPFWETADELDFSTPDDPPAEAVAALD
jgi:prevent-host-death family protein